MNKSFRNTEKDIHYTNLLETVLDHISEAIYISAEDGRILFINREAELTDGINRDEFIGLTEEEVYKTQNHQYVVDHKRPILNEKITYTAQDGQVKLVLHSVYPYEVNGEIKGSFSISKDITKVDKYISKIYQLQQELKIRKMETAKNGTRYTLDDIIGKSVPMLKAIQAAHKAARFHTNVLICGETGTGKELFAQGIHNASAFKDEPFVGLNCAAIPENLMESTLFGTVKGAFTGAQDTTGLFEQAGKGTLFLDEIDSMPQGMQAKLLRALQEKKVRKIGGKEEYPINCRIISATNDDIEQALAENKIRSDIYYRLSSIVLEIPPLRSRKGDMAYLIRHFIKKCHELYGTSIEDIDDEALKIIQEYTWPGNVREMENLIEGIVILAGDEGKIIKPGNLPERLRRNWNDKKGTADKKTKQVDLNALIDDFERNLILDALKGNKGNLSATARSLSIHRNVLYGKMERLGISWQEKK